MAMIYLSGSWARRDELRGYKAELESDGHIVTSTWLTEGIHESKDDGFSLDLDRLELQELAFSSFHDIIDAEVFVAFTEEAGSPLTRGGRHVEFGYAIGIRELDGPWELGKFFMVGPAETMFYAINEVGHYEGFPPLREMLSHDPDLT